MFRSMKLISFLNPFKVNISNRALISTNEYSRVYINERLRLKVSVGTVGGISSKKVVGKDLCSALVDQLQSLQVVNNLFFVYEILRACSIDSG